MSAPKAVALALIAVALTVLGMRAVADQMVGGGGGAGLTLPFTGTTNQGHSATNPYALSLANSGDGEVLVLSGAARAASGFATLDATSTSTATAAKLSNTNVTGGYDLTLVANTAQAPLSFGSGMASTPSGGANEGDVYYNGTTGSLHVANNLAVFRRIPVGFGPTAMTSGVLTVTVESGSVGCTGADTTTGIACTCVISGTTLTASCTAGGSNGFAGFYY